MSTENLSIEEKKALLKKLLQQKVEKPAATEVSSEKTKVFMDFDSYPEIQALEEQFKNLDLLQIDNPYFRVNQTITNNKTRILDREMVSYASYNYLGLSGDERVSNAAKQAIDEYGTSVSASRVATGEKPLHQELEDEIADLLGVEASIVFVGGHTTNVNTIGHLMRPNDLIVFDALSHNCIIEGIKLSGARSIPFPHEDWEAAEQVLQENRHKYERCMICLEGVYSMDGDIGDLPKAIELRNKYNALLFVDEAHSMGVIGPNGLGLRDHFDVPGTEVDLWMGTFSKSFSSCGGYIAGKKKLIDYMKYTTPGFLYSVGISPANAAAALESTKIMKAEPWRAQKLQANSKFFLEAAQERGLDTGISKDTAVVPIIVRNSMHALMLAHRLFEANVNVQPILYPAVPDNEARLRFFITSMHTVEEMTETLDMIQNLLATIREEIPEQAMA